MFITNLGQFTNPSVVRHDSETALANTAVVITLVAREGYRNVLHGMQWSYDTAPTGGRLTVEDGAGNSIWDVDITAAADRLESFYSVLVGSSNTAMILTLAAAGAGVIGKLNCQHILYP